MQDIENYIDQLNRLPVDIRAEVLVANLLETGLAMDDIVVSPVGLFRRNFQNDVGKAEILELTRGQQKKLRLEINRDGLYDALPEGLFHQPTDNKLPGSKPEVLREIKQQQEREAAARRFFLPLEQEYYRLRVKLVLEERKYLFDGDSFLEGDLFSEFWNFPAFLTPPQIHNLLYLLPMVHRIAGDWEQIRLSFETLLEDAVYIVMEQPLQHVVLQEVPALGDARLGVDWIMGDTYEEVHQAIVIQITPTDPAKISHYIPNGVGRRLIQYLSSYLLPLETDYRIEIKIPDSLQEFTVTDMDAGTWLGYTTYL